MPDLPETTWHENAVENAKFVIDCHDGPNIWYRAKTPAYWLAKEFLERKNIIASASELLATLEYAIEALRAAIVLVPKVEENKSIIAGLEQREAKIQAAIDKAKGTTIAKDATNE